MTFGTAISPELAQLRSTTTIRERCTNVLAAAESGASTAFAVHRERLPACADVVAEVTRRRFPSLAIPYHSRWRHFEAGGVDRARRLDRRLDDREPAHAALARIDLAIVSVLLDAGAGAEWSYFDASSGERYSRSEGLGVASFEAFCSGLFSARMDDPLRVDSSVLATIDAPALARVFQAGETNPLVGLEGRAALLRRLAATVTGRPSSMFATLLAGAAEVPAAAILATLLDRTSAIWPSGIAIGDVPMGDVWRHPHAGGAGITAGFVPFHKLSQWLAYSLFEPFERAGKRIVDREALTALPEYRNGGLLLDTGVLSLVDPSLALRRHAVNSQLVIEWRALTIALVDALAPLVRERLGRPDLPLACILEGGTWAAGRELARVRRRGDPPIAVASDGTVF